MSIALDTDGGREHPEFIYHQRDRKRMPCSSSSIYGSPEPMVEFFPRDSSFPAVTGVNEKREDDLDSRSSSSIGRNSDSSVDGDDDDSGDNEVQSSYKGPLDTMDALEDVLPVKRGMSQFYNGKSKSFTSLADASSICSITEIAKPENAYTKKRKNLLASTCYWAKSGGGLSRTSSGGGLSKRAMNSSRSVLSLALMSGPESSTSSENSNSNSSSPSCRLPPLHPQAKKASNDGSVSSSPQRGFSGSFRSFSLSDLQCAAAESQRINGPAVKDRG